MPTYGRVLLGGDRVKTEIYNLGSIVEGNGSQLRLQVAKLECGWARRNHSGSVMEGTASLLLSLCSYDLCPGFARRLGLGSHCALQLDGQP